MTDFTDQEADPLLGQRIAQKYLITGLLGQGGMGRVYLAEHQGLGPGALVALKFLLSEYANVASLQERFKREAAALALVRHPGVVSIFDVGVHEGQAYMAMEYVPGISLDDLLGLDHLPMPLHRIGDLYMQLLDVLVAAHSKGVVHRDLKPDNVRITGVDGQLEYVKVLDFGLAAFTHPERVFDAKLTEVGIVQGTPTYMSPEQCRGLAVGIETDVYAWGAMLFYALAGVPPFVANDMAALLTNHMFVEPPFIADVGFKRAVSAGLERVVRDALSKRAEQRPTAAQMRDRFAAALAGTDPDALRQRSADDRQLAAGLSRDDRALTGIASRPEGLRTSPSPEPIAAGAEVTDYPRVLLWGDADDPSLAALQTGLSVAGMRVTMWNKPEPPPAELHGDKIRLVVLAASRGTALVAECHPVPVLVVGVPEASETATWVQAGAGDLVLQGGDPDTAVRKARRMIQRRR